MRMHKTIKKTPHSLIKHNVVNFLKIVCIFIDKMCYTYYNKFCQRTTSSVGRAADS